MPEANQYIFNTKEIIEIFVKKAGVHEGKWTMLVGFGISAGNFGPSIDQVSPGVAVVANQFGIQRAAPDTPEAMLVDAAIANPKAA
jgi:hypothetical protein